MPNPSWRTLSNRLILLSTLCYCVLGTTTQLLAVPSITGDLDEDESVTISDLALLVSHLQGVQILPTESLPFADANQDSQVTTADIEALADLILGGESPDPVPLATITETLPQEGEGGVAVTRESIVYFSLPIADDTDLTNDNFYAIYSGDRLDTRIELSSDRLKATLFFLEQLPSDARIRIVFDAEGINDTLDRGLDVDEDGEAGGLYAFDFETVSITALTGTAISGTVYAAEKNSGGQNVPLQGVEIEVVGAEETTRATTDVNGDFTLDPSPSGRFFVNIDGRPVTGGFPNGDYYPFVGKAWTAVAGRTDNLVNETGEIFLPLITGGTLQTVSQSEDTTVSFPQSVLDATPELEGVEITIPAASLFDNSGARGGQVGIAPVPADRIPEPLPEGLDLPLVITVQTNGPQNFDRPVPARFPNLPDPDTGIALAPGTKSALWSFNHDTGLWEIGGPMTVTADGQFVETDEGVGIRQPGWHGSLPGTQNNRGGGGGGGYPRDDDDDDDDDDDEEDDDDDEKDCRKEAALAVSGYLQAYVSTGMSIPQSLPFGAGLAISTAINSAGAAVDSLIDPDNAGDYVRGAIKNTAIGAPSIIPYPPVSIGFSYLAVLDAWASFGTRLGDLIGCAAPLPLGQRPGIILPYSSRTGGPDVVNLLNVDESVFPLAASYDQYLQIQIAYLQAAYNYYVAFLGSANWANAAAEDLDAYNRYLQFIFVRLDDDEIVDAAEKIEIQNALTRPSLITDGDIDQLVDRFNRILSTGLTEQERLDLLQATQDLKDAVESIKDNTRWEDPMFFWNFYLPALWAELFPPPPPPQIVQRATSRNNDGGGGGSGGSGGGGGATQSVQVFSNVVQKEHLYLIENAHNDFQLRGRTNSVGQFSNLILAPNSVFTAYYYDAEDNEIATSVFRTPESGERNSIPVSQFVTAVDLVDTDGDGAPDLAERIANTDPDDTDSDDDGTTDTTEMIQKTDPNENRPSPKGFIAAARLGGSAIDADARDNLLAVVSTEYELTLYNISNPTDPTRLSTFDLESEPLQVAIANNRAAVVLKDLGMAILDISDPTSPLPLETIYFFPETPTAITLSGRIGYVGLTGGKIAVIDTESSSLLTSFDLTDTDDIVDLATDGRYILSRTVQGFSAGTITSVELESFAVLTERGKLSDPSFLAGNNLNKGFISLGEGFAILTTQRGYSSIDLSNPNQPALIQNYDLNQFGWKQTALNGSGVMLATASDNSTPDGDHDVISYDIGLTASSSTIIETFANAGVSRTIDIYNGYAFVGSDSRIEVIKYLDDDLAEVAPSITIATPSNVTTIEEGQSLPVLTDATDDEQVRNVVFFQDGERVANDGNYPFSADANAPLLSEGVTEIEIFAVASDSAGNQMQSNTLTLQVTVDSTPPVITHFIRLFDQNLVGLLPNEALDPDSIDNTTFFLTSGGSDLMIGTSDDSTISDAQIVLSEISNNIYLETEEPLEAGVYQISLMDATDLVGNVIAETYTKSFTVLGAGQIDVDGDGISDQTESELSAYDPFDPDSDGDGILDGDEDLDFDGLTNREEEALGTDLDRTDTDSDQIKDGDEAGHGTDPTNPDTDGDGVRDGIELNIGTSPTDVDSDDDLLDDGTERLAQTDPLVPTTLQRTVSAPVVQFLKTSSSEPESENAVSAPVSTENQ